MHVFSYFLLEFKIHIRFIVSQYRNRKGNYSKSFAVAPYQQF